jgi:biopolymer transport protein ExbD
VAFNRFDDDGTDEPIVAEINVTPLTDIFLVLLIIFMVTSTALTQQGTPVDLPRSGGGSDRPDGIVVTATADGEIEIEGRRVPLPELVEVLRGELEESATRNVILHGDRTVVLERAIDIMTAAKEAGAEKIAIATEPKAAAPR